MDAVPHEMQRHRMIMGVFYQYLIIELMREASKAPGSHIISASDGDREGDMKADVQTPDFGLRLYMSAEVEGHGGWSRSPGCHC